MAYPIGGTNSIRVLVREYVGNYFGFTAEIKKTEEARDVANAETVKQTAARIEADAKAAALRTQLDKKNEQDRGRADDYVQALDKRMAAVKEGLGGSVDKLNSVHDEAFKFQMDCNYHADKKFNDTMKAGMQIVVQKTQSSVTKASADCEKAKANLRAAEITEYRKKYSDAIADPAIGKLFLILCNVMSLGTTIPATQGEIENANTRMIRLKNALDFFNELVKDPSWSPEGAFNRANDRFFLKFGR